MLSLRRYDGIKNLFDNYQIDEVKKKILTFDEKKDYSNKQLQQIVNIIIIENTIFHLEDMVELPNEWGGEIFNLYKEKLISIGFSNDK